MSFGAVAGAVIGGGLSYAASREQSRAASKPQTSTSSPWIGQQKYLMQGFANAKKGMEDAIKTGTFRGDRTQDWNSLQNTAYYNTNNNANTQAQFGNSLVTQGNRNLNNIGQAGMNANLMYANSGMDKTGRIINGAEKYAQNPYMEDMIDAASRDVTRNLGENQLTALDLGATGSGNMNSSRTGVAQGIMMRGAGDRIADISAGLRGQAYSQGLNMSQDQINTDMRNQQAANQQVLQTGQAGVDTAQAGMDMRNAAEQARFAMGGAWQQQGQNEIDGRMNAFNEQRDLYRNVTGDYMNMINGSYGGTTVTSGRPTGNTINSTIGGAMAGMGMGAALAGRQNNTYSPPTYGQISGYQGQSYGDYMNPFGR